jgi:hypothetical protein
MLNNDKMLSILSNIGGKVTEHVNPIFAVTWPKLMRHFIRVLPLNPRSATPSALRTVLTCHAPWDCKSESSQSEKVKVERLKRNKHNT